MFALSAPRFRGFFCMLLLAGAISWPVQAGLLHQDKVNWFYVEPTSLPATLLPPPPVPQSAEASRQIELVIEAQKHVSSEDRAAMRDEQHVRLELMTQILGLDFTREKKPKAFLVLDHVMADVHSITENDKNFWHTRRPYLADRRVKLLIDPLDDSPAYPSGHTCFARVIAEVLGLIYPDRLAELRKQADALAWHRVEAGVHYPADIDGGRILAQQIIGSLMQNDIFLDDVSDARREAGLPY